MGGGGGESRRQVATSKIWAGHDLPRETFYADFGKAIDRGTAAAFVGAGMSVPAGYVDWRRLMRGFAEELGLDLDIEQDLVAIAQYHLNANNADRSRLHQLLEEFSRPATPPAGLLTLARLPIRTYWTTNYDELLEQALRGGGRTPDVKSAAASMTITRPATACTVYKMHGDLADPASLVISRDDFERYASTHALLLQQLAADLVGRTFIFVGYSFSDPDLEFLLGRLRATVRDAPRTHYTFARRPQPAEFDDERRYEYEANRLHLRIHDLKRYGIQTVLVDDYAEIPVILDELEHRFYRRQIFVSGAAASFEPYGRDRLEELCRRLGARIIDDGYNMVTGFGLGVGSPLIMGALERLYTTDQEVDLERRLRLRPFPQVAPEAGRREALYRQYRASMVRGVGFAVFIAGNRERDGTVELSTGVLEEFELSRIAGAYPIPIGATGWVARQIWDSINTRFETVFPAGTPRAPFEALQDEAASPSELLGSAFELIHLLTPRPRG